MKSSGIGGQAVIEGIMMKNGDTFSIAVRKPDGEIDVQVDAYSSIAGKSVLRKIPIVRGVINFVDSLVLGMKCLTHSADFYDDDEPSKTDDVVQKLFKDRAEDVITGLTVVFSIVMAVGIFMVLPYFIAEYLKKYIVSDTLLAVIEGVIRLLLFIAYVLLISRMRDIQRVFQYHGAEHKCINCIENGWELNTKNVRKASKHHRRCGTSFMLIVMVISIIFFIFIRVESPVQRVLIRVALVPVIAGVSYEFIRFAGNTENAVVRFLSIPGMWLQALTTREPDRKMMEVGIAAVEAVFDWRAYQAGMGVVFETQDDGLDAYMEDGTEETGALAKETAFAMEAETETAEPVSQESVKAEREEDSLEDGKTLEPEKTDDLDGIEILDIEETDKKEEVKKKPEKAAKPQKKKTEKKPFWGRKEKKAEEPEPVKEPAVREPVEEDDSEDWMNPVWGNTEPKQQKAAEAKKPARKGEPEQKKTRSAQTSVPVETQEDPDDWDWRNPVWSRPEPETAAEEKTEGTDLDIPEILERSDDGVRNDIV